MLSKPLPSKGTETCKDIDLLSRPSFLGFQNLFSVRGRKLSPLRVTSPKFLCPLSKPLPRKGTETRNTAGVTQSNA